MLTFSWKAPRWPPEACWVPQIRGPTSPDPSGVPAGTMEAGGKFIRGGGEGREPQDGDTAVGLFEAGALRRASSVSLGTTRDSQAIFYSSNLRLYNCRFRPVEGDLVDGPSWE